MSFDPRSMERLRQLGRQLPEPLAKPEAPTGGSSKPTRKLHRVETEDDPQALFHELMKVSADGTVPEHLMTRLKQAEAKAEQELKRPSREATPRPDSSTSPLPSPPGRQAGKGKNTQPRRPQVVPGSEEESMYVAFGQLFLEDDEDTP